MNIEYGVLPLIYTWGPGLFNWSPLGRFSAGVSPECPRSAPGVPHIVKVVKQSGATLRVSQVTQAGVICV